jgi:uncharacterized membrane protein
MTRAAHALYLTALGIWVGGMATLGFIVAPTVFRTTPSRLLAGTIFGAVLQRFGPIQIALAVTCLAALGVLIAGGALRGRRAVVRIGGVAIMLALVLVSHLYLAPEIIRERESIANFDSVPSGVPAKARFDRLHRTSVQVAGATLILGAALLVCAAWTSRPGDGP